MSKKICFIFLFFLTLNLSFGANVEIDAHVYQDYSILNYVFSFDDNETINKFSLEKPKDAEVDYVVDKNGPIRYEMAGDYLILKPEENKDNVILLRIKTKSLSEDIVSTESFKSYQDFNFEVNNFNFEVIFKEDFGEIISVFPSNNSIIDKSKIEWNENNLNKNAFYVINFKKEIIDEETSGNYYNSYLFISGLVLILILVLIILFFIYPRYLKKYLKKEKINQNKDSVSEDKKVSLNDKKNKIEKDYKNNVEEIIEKHLTDNEKSIVQLIKEHEGLSQNDILDYLPSLTKSNLSKIISKLHGKRILKRIRVGKINNIYLGDKLEPKVNDKKSQEEEEY